MYRRIAILIVAMAVLVPTPAYATGSLPRGTYNCYYWDAAFGGLIYSNFDLKIRRDNRYAFVSGDDVLGRPGRYRHSTDGRRIRFPNGYLHGRFRGGHYINPSGHTISLESLTNEGFEYLCSN